MVRRRSARGDNANRGKRHELSCLLIHPIRRLDFVLSASLRCGLYGNDIEAVGGGRRYADCAVLHRRGGAALRILRSRLLRQLVHAQSRSVRPARCAAWATVRHDVPTLRQRLLVQGQWSPGRRCKRLCGKRRELHAGAAAVYLPAAAANPWGHLAAAARAVSTARLANQTAAHHVIDTILDVSGQRFLCGSPLSRERTFDQRAMFAGRSLATVDSRYHLVA